MAIGIAIPATALSRAAIILLFVAATAPDRRTLRAAAPLSAALFPAAFGRPRMALGVAEPAPLATPAVRTAVIIILVPLTAEGAVTAPASIATVIIAFVTLAG